MQKESHLEQVRLLQEKIKKGGSISLAGAKTSSNTTRFSPYKQKSERLNISHLDSIVEVDFKNKTALVQPRMSMYGLCTELARHKLSPKVVPEFKGITVGGAINGCGGESNSHRVGLFHNNCLEYELILGNAEKCIATRQNYSDLFSALHGSYGSLALLTSAKIELIDTPNFVHVRYHHFTDCKKAVEHIQNSQAHFVEGIIFSENHAVIIEGDAVQNAAGSIFKLSERGSPWFYQHAQNQKSDLFIPYIDYLFRHDRGAFWMGAYVIQPTIVTRFLTEAVYKIKKPSQNKLTSKIAFPSKLIRYLTATVMQSQPLYNLLHKGEAWVEDRFIIQDLTLPESKAFACLEYLFSSCPIYPLWLCPVQKSPKEELFCPTALRCEDARCLNIGVYGVPDSQESTKLLLRQLELKLQELQGRKWLYTNSEYTPERFWQIYPETEYNSLRKKYNSEGIFLSIDKKVLK